MKFEILPSGNLQISIETDDDREEIQSSLANANDKDIGVMSDILEMTGWTGNGKLYMVLPESIGALTEAPILSDDVTFDGDGKQIVDGSVWWFPNYMVESFAETLLADGAVIFDKAPEPSFSPHP